MIHAESFAAAAAEAGRALVERAEGSLQAATEGEWTELEVHAGDQAALLVEWLNELIFHAESDGWVPGDIEVLECLPNRLRARVRRRCWPSRAFPIKAATLDRASVEAVPGGVVAEVTLDV